MNRALRVDHVYFTVRGVIPMVNEPDAGEIVEFATIGFEGMAGFPALLSASPCRARWCKFPGKDRMRTAALKQILKKVTQIAQGTSCDRLHEVQQSVRWLLQTHDRADSYFTLKPEFLAQMLGVHRPSVSVAAGLLQERLHPVLSEGTSPFLTGKVSKGASCSCYGFIKKGNMIV